MKVHQLFLWGVCTALASCMMGPNYRPPENCVSDCWVSNTCSETVVPTLWWEEFNDPLLNNYIAVASYYNKDVLTAEASILQARAIRKIVASDLFPHLNFEALFSRTYFSKNGPVFAIGAAQTVTTPGLPFELQIPQIQNIFTILFDASWEIDLFGKTRRAVEAAVAHIGSAIEQRNNVLISIYAEIALNYMDLRSTQQMGVLIEKNISLLEKKQHVTQKQLEEGLINRLVLDKIEAELAQQRSTLPPIVAEIYQYIYAISVLTGCPPETLLAELLPIQALPTFPQEVASGLKSDLLRRRPDVRQAERNLAAATANIGVAVASFFPTLSLTGGIGLQSLHLNNLFQANSKTWELDAGLVTPLFQGGNLVGHLRLSESQAMSAALIYQQTVLTALEEAESTLIAYKKEEESAYRLKQSYEKYQEIALLSLDRFEKGLVTINDVIDSETQAIVARENLLESETAVLIDIVALYKALGGGWECS